MEEQQAIVMENQEERSEGKETLKHDNREDEEWQQIKLDIDFELASFNLEVEDSTNPFLSKQKYQQVLERKIDVETLLAASNAREKFFRSAFAEIQKEFSTTKQ